MGCINGQAQVVDAATQEFVGLLAVELSGPSHDQGAYKLGAQAIVHVLHDATALQRGSLGLLCRTLQCVQTRQLFLLRSKLLGHGCGLSPLCCQRFGKINNEKKTARQEPDQGKNLQQISTLRSTAAFVQGRHIHDTDPNSGYCNHEQDRLAPLKLPEQASDQCKKRQWRKHSRQQKNYA